MQIQIQVKGLASAARLRSFAAENLNVALAQFSHAIDEVSLRLHDINGPERAGVDKLCRVVLRLKDNSVMVVEDLGADVMRTIDRATGRLRQSVAKHLARVVPGDRTGRRPASALARPPAPAVRRLQ